MTVANDTSVAIGVEHIGKVFTGVDVHGRLRPGTALRVTLNIVGFNFSLRGNDPAATVADQGPALEDVSFQVAKSTVVALTGPSGSGKSTLLKILGGSLAPTTGRALLRGRVGRVIDPAGELEPQLNALENIEAHLKSRPGAKAATVDVDAILDFAGLKGFEELPVRKYSSGMLLRLSIAIALHGGPDVLLIDDVLRVGDIGFQEQCRKRLLDMKAAGVAILIASSDEDFIDTIADRVIELRDGRLVPERTGSGPDVDGPSADGYRIHVSHFPHANAAIETTSVEVHQIERDGARRALLCLGVRILAKSRVRACIDLIKGRQVAFRSLAPHYMEFDAGTEASFTVEVPLELLGRGDYAVNTSFVSLLPDNVLSLKTREAMIISVEAGGAGAEPLPEGSLVGAQMAWELEPVGKRARAAEAVA